MVTHPNPALHAAVSSLLAGVPARPPPTTSATVPRPSPTRPAPTSKPCKIYSATPAS
jgi:hypothetical protein